MTADVDVQFFSHLNGLTLGDNWGDLIRLLDTCLVSGLALPSINSASIDAQGDITLNLYSNHKCMLFQIVELTGFNSVSIGGHARQVNGKYRIKGVPAANQLILKGLARTDESPSVVNLISIGTAKIASLSYEIIFRDAADVKRVYRAKNPTSTHPFIRVDETISDGTNSYTSTYAKYAMVGLLENMEHIDDYENPDVLQLPFDPAAPAKNWKITGSGTSVVRGWCKWYWASNYDAYQIYNESISPGQGNRNFTLCGTRDAFFLSTQIKVGNATRQLMGCGLYDSSRSNDIIPNWFLLAAPRYAAAGIFAYNTDCCTPLQNQSGPSGFLIPSYNQINRLSNHSRAIPVLATINSGKSIAGFNTDFGAMQIPFYDSQGRVRGVLPQVCYAGNAVTVNRSNVSLQDGSMFVSDKGAGSDGNTDSGGFHFYLGELE